MELSNKIFYFNDIKKKLLNKIKNKKVVLCHGVFDLLHIGHLNHFEEAKKFGEILIVSITDDAFVKKGPNRPVFKSYERSKMICALSYVDYVIINNNFTAENVIKTIKPSVYAKGIDYLNSKNDFTNNINSEIRSVKSVNGVIKITKSAKLGSSKILKNFDLIFSNEQKIFLKKFEKSLTMNKVNELFDQIKKMKVLIVGELIIDQYVLCEPLGKSGKEAFLTFKKNNEVKFLGGSGFIANQISNFVKNVDLVTVLGDLKADKKFIKKKLNKNIIIKSFLKKNSPTITKTRFVDNIDFKKIIGVYDINDQKIDNSLENKLSKFIQKNRDKYDLILVSDFGHGMITKKLAKFLCKTKKFLSVNAQVNSSNRGERNLTKYRNVDCVFINSSELTHETGIKAKPETLGRALKKNIKARNLVITKGSSGSLVVNNRDKIIDAPAFAKNKKDKVGAGDALMAIFSILKAKNIDDQVSLFVASLGSGYTVEQFGNDKPITLSQMKKILSHILV